MVTLNGECGLEDHLQADRFAQMSGSDQDEGETTSVTREEFPRKIAKIRISIRHGHKAPHKSLLFSVRSAACFRLNHD